MGYRLSKGLINRGHDVTYLVDKKYSQENFVKEIKKPPTKNKRVSSKIMHRLGLNTITLNTSFPFSLGRDFINDFDIIHLHDAMGGYFNLVGLIWLSRLKPVVWTLHAMWPFTGACLYSYDCERWKKNCGKCPQFGQFPLNWLHRDGSILAINAKRLIYRCSRLFPVGVSEWVSNLAKQGMLRRFNIETISNGVDTSVFYPMNKKEAKARLKIPPEAKTIMFSVSSNPDDKRKGTDIILKALSLLKTKDVFLVPLAITPRSRVVAEDLNKYPALKMAHVENEEELNLIYNAADVVWHPTRADTSSLVILEAFAAGTPVLASRVGGVQEIVTDGETGFLIEPGNHGELAEKTDILFSDAGKRKSMSETARARAVSGYSMDLFLDKYESLYRKALKEEG